MKNILILVLTFINTTVFAQSNNCATATPLTVNSTCTFTSGTTVGATSSFGGCVGNADDDVWYSFTANNTQQVITVSPSVGMDPVVQLFSGACATLNSLYCQDDGFSGDQEVITATGLTVGTTYLIRVYNYWSGSGTGTFNICVQGFNIANVTNDNACSAIDLGPVTQECNYQNFTTVGATTSTPSVTAGCSNSGDSKGGWGAGTRDVWFKVTVPASGKIAVTQQPGYGNISDGVMALYTGTCGALTQINCDDDGGPNCSSGCLNPSGNNMPVISQTGLAPGSTVYIRFWAYGTASAGGNFGICVTTSNNDNCSTSLYICDLDGYKGTTGPLYTPDRPSNMSGTSNGSIFAAEPNGYVNSSIKGGPFGLNSCDTGDYRRVTIDNNSWITFTASSSTATLDVNVGSCYRNRGVQFQVFKVSAPCTNFDTVSGILQNYYISTDATKPYCTSISTGTFIPSFTVVCRNLIAGQKYYLMIDGFGGDICNYSISAKSGVQAAPVINQFPNNSLCRGDSVLLNFNKTLTGAFNFYFLGPNGDTISTPGVDTFVWVKPLVTSNYGLVIESVCGNKQSTTKTVNVYSSLDGGQIAFNGNSKSLSICSGDDPAIILGSTTALAVAPSGGNGPWAYQWQYRDNCIGPWQNIPSSNTISYNPPSGLITPRCYRRISSNSCGSVISDSVLVNIFQIPTIDMDLKEVCAGKTINLTPTDTSYGSSNNFTNYLISGSNLTPIINNGSYSPLFNSSSFGNFTFTYSVTDANTCSASDTFSVIVNPNPVINIVPVNIESCLGDSISLNVTANSGHSPYSYSWTGPDSIYLDNPQIPNPIFNSYTSGTFNLNIQVIDNKGCSTNQTKSITIYNNPKVSISNPIQDVCLNNSINLNTVVVNNTGAVNYSWSGQTSGLNSTSSPNPNFNGNTPGIYNLQVWISDSKTCSDSASINITVNDLPLISSVNTTPLSYCGTNDGTILINASGFGSITYSIDSGNTFLPNSLFNGLSNGTYHVVVKDDSSCISNVYTVTVNNGGAPSNPDIVSSNQTICEGNTNPTLTASGTGLGQLSWYINYPGQVIATGNSYTPLSQDTGVNTYYVIENINTCLSDTSIISFNVLSAPKNPIFTKNDTTICQGTTLTIVAPNNPNNVIYYVYDNNTALPPVLGTLNYTIQNINNSITLYIQAEQNYGGQVCKSTDTLSSYFINVNSAPSHPNLTAGDDTICEGSSTIINATPLGNTYLLLNASSTVIDTLSATVNPTITTTYYIETYSNIGCRALGNKDSITITVNAAPNNPQFNSNNKTVCLGDSVTLDVQNPVNGENYSIYDFPGNNFIGNAPLVVSPSVNTDYIIIATDINGCKNLGANDSCKVILNPLPASPLISLNPNDTVCAGTQVTITALGTQPGEYVLLFDQLTGGNMIDTLNYSFIASTTVTYYAQTENNFGCRNSEGKQPVLIVVNPLPTNPVITSLPSYICEETSAIISATSNPTSSVITWWDGNNISSNVLDTGNTFITPQLNSTTTFYMLATSVEGCTNANGYIPVTVNVRPRPIVTLTSDAVLGYAYQGQLITFTAEPFGYQNYIFYINNNLVQNSSSNTYQNNSLNNNDLVSVSATENGCESLDKAEIKMEIKPLSNAFTPNNDGTNDLFLRGLDLQIINRWGQELYKGKEGWDGTFQGKIVSPGTYFYIVTFKDFSGTETKLNGPVTLIGE